MNRPCIPERCQSPVKRLGTFISYDELKQELIGGRKQGKIVSSPSASGHSLEDLGCPRPTRPASDGSLRVLTCRFAFAVPIAISSWASRGAKPARSFAAPRAPARSLFPNRRTPNRLASHRRPSSNAPTSTRFFGRPCASSAEKRPSEPREKQAALPPFEATQPAPAEPDAYDVVPVDAPTWTPRTRAYLSAKESGCLQKWPPW